MVALLGLLVLAAAAAFTVSLASPVYDFPQPQPFSGPDIFNPYAALKASSDTTPKASSDTTTVTAKTLDAPTSWKRANFHTHTRVRGPRNECRYWPSEVLEAYRKFDYDILTFSNHNQLTTHPSDPDLQVNIYEHGTNFDKFHKLVLGSHKVNYWNHLVSPLASQRQHELDLLREDADLIVLNHPSRTGFTTRDMMEKLSGYEIIELDSGITTDQYYWDWALSSGHYSFGLANDDLHFPDRTDKIAVRCNFLYCDSARYEDILNCLRLGAFYSMRVPDYGDGDWDAKYEANKHLPAVRSIGARADTVYLQLTEKASEIRLTGQNGATLANASDCDSLSYVFAPEDTYARFTAFFSDGAVIYTNPFARYDASVAASPYTTPGHPVNLPLTILFNLLLMVLTGLYFFLGTRIFRRWSKMRTDTASEAGM